MTETSLEEIWRRRSETHSDTTITFSGFSQGSNSGDSLDTTNGHIFDITLSRIGGNPHRLVSALQCNVV